MAEAIRDVRSQVPFMTLVGAGMMNLVPILGQIVLAGWTAEATKRTALGVPNNLPPFRFDDFGYWLRRGVPPYVSTLVYTSVAGLLSSLIMVPFFFGLVFLDVIGVDKALVGVLTFFMFGFMMMYSYFLAVVGNAASTIADMSGDMNQAFNLKLVKTYVQHTIGNSLWATFLLSTLALTLLLPSVMLVITYPALIGFILAVNGVVRGQIHQVYVARGGAPVGVEAPEFLAGEAGYQPPQALPPGMQQTPWTPPSGAQPHWQAPYGQPPSGSPYGQAPQNQSMYGQAPYGEAPYGQAPYGRTPTGSPYGQAPHGQPANDNPAPGYGVPPGPTGGHDDRR
jgi:hypothetical protein